MLFSHLPLSGNGAWGVDLFFVISGFIMCFVTESGHQKHFFQKRIIRIVPLYWAGTLGVFIAALFIPSMKTTPDPVHLAKSLAFIPFANGDSHAPLLSVGWTLNFEMLFYSLFAISMAISHRYRALLCAAVLLVLSAAGLVVTFQNVPMSFYCNGMLIEFVFGILCYTLYKRTERWRNDAATRPTRIVFALLGLVAMACLHLTEPLRETLPRTVIWGPLATVSFVLLVHGCSGMKMPRAMLAMGDASYSLYLFHPYILKTFGTKHPAFRVPSALGYLLSTVAVAVCCVIGVGIYRLIELPVTTKLRSLLKPQKQHSVAGAEAPGLD